MLKVKSITPVRYFGHNSESDTWAAQVTFEDGSVKYAGIGASYSLEQAETFISNNTIDTMTLEDLPGGVSARSNKNLDETKTSIKSIL